jgi:hypothetical protein
MLLLYICLFSYYNRVVPVRSLALLIRKLLGTYLMQVFEERLQIRKEEQNARDGREETKTTWVARSVGLWYHKDKEVIEEHFAHCFHSINGWYIYWRLIVFTKGKIVHTIYRLDENYSACCWCWFVCLLWMT